MIQRPPLLDRAHLKRRIGLAAGRLRHSLRGGLERPCVFMHLPKCGGTSLTAALAGTVGIQNRVGTIDALATRRAAGVLLDGADSLVTCHEDLDRGDRTFALREAALVTYMAQGCRLIHGHVFFCPGATHSLGHNYAWVTVMRDPMSRALSNYRMAVHARIIPDDVDGWLDSQTGRRMAQAALRYLSAQNTIEDEAAAMDRARHALDSFALVGVLEDLEPFLDEFARMFGARPRVPRLNTGRGPKVALTDRQTARLMALTAPDRALYAMAWARTKGVDAYIGTTPAAANTRSDTARAV